MDPASSSIGKEYRVTIYVAGVDPGLVHTGVVRLEFEPEFREITVCHTVINGPSPSQVRHAAFANFDLADHGFIEGYRPRSNLGTDKRMVEAVQAIRQATGFKVLLNTGVKKVVKQPLMDLLGVWKFSTPTHHDDLRSAARIALLGMLKDDGLNALVTDVVRSHLAGRTWRVHSIN